MTQDQVVLAILGALIVLNVSVAIWVALRAPRRRRSTPAAATEGGPITAADVEAFVAGVLPDQPASARQLAVASADGDGEDVVAPGTGNPIMRQSGSGPTPPEWSARLVDPAMWSPAICEESARLARFRHPMTVVMAELPQFDALGAGLGRDTADRVARETARLLVAEAREADRIVWFPDARFRVLLLETEEETALGYVKRVRAATDGWLSRWASPSDYRSVGRAHRTEPTSWPQQRLPNNGCTMPVAARRSMTTRTRCGRP